MITGKGKHSNQGPMWDFLLWSGEGVVCSGKIRVVGQQTFPDSSRRRENCIILNHSTMKSLNYPTDCNSLDILGHL